MNLNFLLFPLSMLGLITINACSKENPDRDTEPLWLGSIGSPPETPVPYTPKVANVSGTLVCLSVIHDYSNTINPSGGFQGIRGSEIAVAHFSSSISTSSFDPAGTVSINDIPLDKDSNNIYFKSATLDFRKGKRWHISGSDRIHGFVYSDTGTFIDYKTNHLPAVVERSKDFILALGGYQPFETDSAYVVVQAGDQSVCQPLKGDFLEGTISSEQLQDLPETLDYSATIQIILCQTVLDTINGGTYAFVRETAIVHNVSIR